MVDVNKVDLAWKTVLKFSGIICITSFFCLMLFFIVGIHNWTLAAVFFISLAGSLCIITQFDKIKEHEPAYRQFVITVSMFALILFFMALTVKKISDSEFQNLMLYGTLPVMVNFLMVLPKWIYDRYQAMKRARNQEQQEVNKVKQGLYGGDSNL